LKLSVIIVNYNVKFFLEQCLCSLHKAIQQTAAEVIVIDNCSTDGSMNYLKHKFPWVQFIENTKNEGFAKANNSALKQCSGEYVLFLNPDTIVPENILLSCTRFFETHKNTGALGVKMIDGSAAFLPESKRAFPSPFVSFFKLCGLADLFPKSKLFNRYALGYLDKDAIHEVDILCGAFLMAKRNILNQLNGFDEAFFMYGEDIDLCHRIKQTGAAIYYLGTETIIHFKGESSGKDKVKYVQVFYGAMRVFVKKYYTGSSAWFMNMLLHTGIYTRAFASLLAAPFAGLNHKKNIERNSNILLTGDPVSVTEAETIVRKNSPGAAMEKAVLPNSQLAHSDEPTEIIFCTGSLSYLESIQFILAAKKAHNYKWHGLNTECVVGSTNKNFTGVVYSLED